MNLVTIFELTDHHYLLFQFIFKISFTMARISYVVFYLVLSATVVATQAKSLRVDGLEPVEQMLQGNGDKPCPKPKPKPCIEIYKPVHRAKYEGLMCVLPGAISKPSVDAVSVGQPSISTLKQQVV